MERTMTIIIICFTIMFTITMFRDTIIEIATYKEYLKQIKDMTDEELEKFKKLNKEDKK